MNSINESLSNNGKKKYNYNIKYPFIKIKTNQGKDKKYFMRKIINSDKIIDNNMDTLLYSGFDGTKEDFLRIYGKKDSKKKINKSRYKSKRHALIINPNFLAKSIKMKKIKDYNNSANYNKKKIGMLSLLNFYKSKNKTKKENISGDDSQTLGINQNKNGYQTKSKNDSSSNKARTIKERNNSSENKDRIKKIKKMYKILKSKSNEILALGNNTFEIQKQNKKLIPNIKLGKGNDKFKPKKTVYTKFLSNSCKIDDKKIIQDINKIFNKYLPQKNDDNDRLRKVLDPLKTIFKSNLREVKKIKGNDHENIWMKRSTANIISFGKTFQSISDDVFIKMHKSIMRKYPEVQKDANIMVPSNNERDNSIIKKLQSNQRKIRLISNDNDALMRGIKNMYKEYNLVRSSSNPLIKHKLK